MKVFGHLVSVPRTSQTSGGNPQRLPQRCSRRTVLCVVCLIALLTSFGLSATAIARASTSLNVSTFAGLTGSAGSADGIGSAARFWDPSGVAVDRSGNVYVADRSNRTVRKITPAGVVTTLAGSAGNSGSVDGTGSAARFEYPSGIAVDGFGNVYVVDDCTIRMITPAGVVTTLAGSAGSIGSADGLGSAARFWYPWGIAVNAAGSVVYVADTQNHTIRKIVTATGIVTTLAGSAGSDGHTDATGSAARFCFPKGIAVDGSGDVYVADSLTCVIRKITPSGAVSTLAGFAGASGSTDGTGLMARFASPSGVAVDIWGDVYVTDNHTIRVITPAGAVTTLAGLAGSSGSTDGAAGSARFSYPDGLALDATGDIYVADTGNSTIRASIDTADPVTSVSGNQKTGLPVLVLVAGLYSDTGDHMVNGLFGWSMNERDNPGGPWNYIGQQTVCQKLGACKIMVMPTADGASHWPQDVRDAGHVIDSSGRLDYNVKQLAAWLTEQQADGEFGDHPVILVCHSYGGVIARSMLASDTLKPGSDARRSIAGIIQLGCPNGGSGAADYANAHPNQARLVGGKKCEATEDLSIAAMEEWNGAARHRHPVSVPIVRFAGTYLPAVLTSMGRWDSQYPPAAFLRNRHRDENGLYRSNDGMVASDSLKDAFGRLDDPKRDFGESFTGQLFASRSDLSHDTPLPGTNRTYGGVTVRALVPQSDEGCSAPLFAPLKKAIANLKEIVGSAGQQAASQFDHRLSVLKTAADTQLNPPSTMLPERTIFVSGGNSVSTTLPLDASANIVVSSSVGTPTVTVHDPAGATLETPTWSEVDTDGVATTVLQVDATSPGDYIFDVALPPGTSGDVTLAGSMEGGAQLALSADGTAHAGDSVTLTAHLVSASGQPLLDATVSGVARLNGANDVALGFHDDGLAPDTTAADGAYAASFTPLTLGRWLVEVDADAGSALRVSSIVVDAGTQVATVTGPLSEVAEPGPGETVSSFGVEVPLHVSEAGTYTVSGALADAAGTDVGTVQTSADLTADQSTTLTATIDASQLSGIATGNLTIGPLAITRYTDGVELNAGETPGFTTTRSYSASDFYTFSVSLEDPTTNPSPTSIVYFSGTAVNTASTIVSVEYTIDGGSSWHVAAPGDGSFNSHSEDFTIELELPDYVYGILVRATAADGTVLPVADWPGTRFIVDTVTPVSVAGLTASIEMLDGSPVAHASWLPSEMARLTVSSVSYSVSLDGSRIGGTYDGAFSVPGVASGEHTLTVTPVDDAGNVGPAESITIVVDTVAPTTVTNADALWHNTDVRVTLTPHDIGGSGMTDGYAKTEYRFDSGEWTTGTEVLVSALADHSNDGEHTLLYRSTDAAGNEEDVKNALVRIDTTAPAGTFTIASGASTTTSATVAVGSSVSDAHGPLQMRISVDGKASWSGWEAYAASKNVTLPSGYGSKSVVVQYRDAAGNVLEVSDSIELVAPPDLVPPTVSMSGATDGAWYRGSVRVSLSASDTDSGVASITYVLDGATTTVPAAGKSIDIPAVPNGAHLLTFHATDNATNCCSDQSVRFFVDTVGPVTAGKNASGRRGRTTRLCYRAIDKLSPAILAPKLVVKNSRGQVVKTFRTAPATSRTSGTWYRASWRPKVKGVYRYYVYAKDLAGNPQSRMGSARITVR